LNSVERRWTVLNSVERCWTALNSVEQHWTVLNSVEQCWTVLNGVEWCWMVLNGVEWCWMGGGERRKRQSDNELWFLVLNSVEWRCSFKTPHSTRPFRTTDRKLINTLTAENVVWSFFPQLSAHRKIATVGSWGAVHKKSHGSNNLTDFFTGHLSTSAVFLAKESSRFRSLFKDACVR
jgi:hypothetical protein